MLQKSLAKEGKFKKTGVFICTNDELIEAVRKKQKYMGLADAIINNKDIPKSDFKISNSEDLKNALAIL